MSKIEVGDRVGALERLTDGVMYLVGYGVRVDDCVPDDDAAGQISQGCRLFGIPTPCIQLDSGERVWGSEVHWTGEEKVQEEARLCKEVVHVSVEELRGETE